MYTQFYLALSSKSKKLGKSCKRKPVQVFENASKPTLLFNRGNEAWLYKNKKKFWM